MAGESRPARRFHRDNSPVIMTSQAAEAALTARQYPISTWMAAAFGAAILLAALALARFGAGERGTDIALQATARLAFLLFFAAYAGAPLATLFGARFHTLRAHGRQFGLAFAAAQTVHAILIGWLCWIGATPVTGVFITFGPALFCVYGLAIFSFGDLHRIAGGVPWWLIRRIGMNLIAYAFALDFLHHPFSVGLKHAALYLPFASLSLLGPCLYAAALIKTAAAHFDAEEGKVFFFKKKNQKTFGLWRVGPGERTHQ
jgi:hypothetical protein